MPNYRRPVVAGGTFFFTVVTAGRAPILLSPLSCRLLRAAIEQTRAERPFDLLAFVLLPEHLHAMWTLPDGDEDFSTRWAAIKARFTHGYLAAGGAERPTTNARAAAGGRGVWQARFWDHLIRDEDDFARHLDYVHYNPVKHGLADCAHAWPHSTFGKWVGRRVYERSWGCLCAAPRRPPDFSWADAFDME